MALNSKSSTIGLKALGKPIKIVVLIFALILSWLLFLQPQYGKFSSEAAARRAAEQELLSLEDEIREIDNLTSVLTDLPTEEIEKLNLAIPTYENTDDLLNSIEKIANQTGLTIRSLNVRPQDLNQILGFATDPSQYVPDSEFGRSDISITAEGNYTSLLQFLTALENSARLVDVINFSLNSQINQAGQSNLSTEQLQVSIAGYAYHLNALPNEPIFPYGMSLDFSLLESPQYQRLQSIPFVMPAVANQPNPFAP